MIPATENETESFLERISELEETVANLRRLEATIARNARTFEALLGASHDGIALTGADGHIIRVVRSILGYPPNVLNGIPIADLVHPEDRDAILDCYGRLVLDRTQRARCEVRVQKARGGYLWV